MGTKTQNVRKTPLTKESSQETLTSSRKSLMTGSSCQAAHENGTALDPELGLFLCLPWVRERGSDHYENLLRSLGRNVLSWARGALGACLLGTGDCFFEVCSPGRGGWCLALSFIRGTLEIRMETQLGPKWRHFCLHVSITKWWPPNS
jgi:hypothetical protein